jgi:hypothetical protein
VVAEQRLVHRAIILRSEICIETGTLTVPIATVWLRRSSDLETIAASLLCADGAVLLSQSGLLVPPLRLLRELRRSEKKVERPPRTQVSSVRFSPLAGPKSPLRLAKDGHQLSPPFRRAPRKPRLASRATRDSRDFGMLVAINSKTTMPNEDVWPKQSARSASRLVRSQGKRLDLPIDCLRLVIGL